MTKTENIAGIISVTNRLSIFLLPTRPAIRLSALPITARHICENLSKVCSHKLSYGNELEQSALSRCTLAIFSSEWAANTAVQNYDVHPDKVRVVPFGANLDCNRSLKDIT